MNNENKLTSGVYQKEPSPSGDWNILKGDTNDLITNINNTLNTINGNNNEKIKGYQSSLSNLVSKIENFGNKISSKSGVVKSDDDDYSNFLECRYYIEKEKSELTLLSNTVNVLILTKEI